MNNNTLYFTIPGNPVAKGRARTRVVTSKRTGKSFASHYTPSETRKYEELIANYGRGAMRGSPPHTGAVSLSVVAFFAIPKSWPAWKKAEAVAGGLIHTVKPDGDNVLKSIKDGLNGIAWKDDSQVAESTIRKAYAEVPCVSVLVEPLGGIHSNSTREDYQRARLDNAESTAD